jgi:hypothetical protein
VLSHPLLRSRRSCMHYHERYLSSG